MTGRQDIQVVGVRLARNGRLIPAIVTCSRPTENGEVVLLDHEGEQRLAQVVVSAEQLLSLPSGLPIARVLAIGVDDPAVANALNARDLAALASASALTKGSLGVQAAHWSLDLARLTLDVEAHPGNLPDSHLALARHFRAEIRIVVADREG